MTMTSLGKRYTHTDYKRGSINKYIGGLASILVVWSNMGETFRRIYVCSKE